MIANAAKISVPAAPAGTVGSAVDEARPYDGIMPGTLTAVDRQGLERFCTSAESIRFGAGAPGLDRASVSLSRTAFAPHRHDAYAVGLTTGGVQTFRYRGADRVCLPGQLHVLYPDELHDGAPGTDDGFTYRILYLAPALVREALADAPLPFVADPVQPVPGPVGPLAAVVASSLADLTEPIDRLRGGDRGGDRRRPRPPGRTWPAPAGDARPAGGRAGARLPGRACGPADQRGHTGTSGRHRPVHDRASFQGRVRHDAGPVPLAAPARPGPGGGRRRTVTGAGRRRRRLRRPEPPHKTLQTCVRDDAGPLAAPSARPPQTRREKGRSWYDGDSPSTDAIASSARAIPATPRRRRCSAKSAGDTRAGCGARCISATAGVTRTCMR
jgi:AraC-like ligand binding domain